MGVQALCDTGTEGVCLYQATNFGGAGNYWGWAVAQLPIGWNNTAQSVRNTFPFTMYMYTQDNYRGAKLAVSAGGSYSNLYNVPTGGATWANQISSFRNS